MFSSKAQIHLKYIGSESIPELPVNFITCSPFLSFVMSPFLCSHTVLFYYMVCLSIYLLYDAPLCCIVYSSVICCISVLMHCIYVSLYLSIRLHLFTECFISCFTLLHAASFCSLTVFINCMIPLSIHRYTFFTLYCICSLILHAPIPSTVCYISIHLLYLSYFTVSSSPICGLSLLFCCIYQMHDQSLYLSTLSIHLL